jgi:hypothetical protein
MNHTLVRRLKVTLLEIGPDRRQAQSIQSVILDPWQLDAVKVLEPR